MNDIRKAKSGDLDDILKVVSEARAFIASYGSDQWQDGYPEPEVIEGDIENAVGYVYENETGIHAYAALIPGHEPVYDQLKDGWVTDNDSYVTLHRLCTDHDCRSRGVGKKMLAQAEAVARENALTSVRVDTHKLNLSMQGLLKKNGYVYCGEVLYEVTEGDPVRICFEKDLTEK